VENVGEGRALGARLVIRALVAWAMDMISRVRVRPSSALPTPSRAACYVTP
jgi:hypothetical protein